MNVEETSAALLRPTKLSEFIGQDRIKNNLRICIKASKERGEPLEHVLFTGLPGLGKTTLAIIIANELGTRFVHTTGPALERAGDLAGILTNLSRGDVLFIDEIHRLSAPVEEYLYSAMEDFSISITLDKGPHARTIKLQLQPFTLIGSTTRESLLSEPFRARFGIIERLEPYSVESLVEILKRSAKLLNISLSEEAAEMLSKASRGIPRLANRLIRRARDFAQVKNTNNVDAAIVKETLGSLEIDDLGLSAVDRKIISILLEAKDKPIGLKTLSAAIGESEENIEEVYEPYLIQLGLVQKTAKGRKIGEKALSLFKEFKPEKKQKKLFTY